MLATHARADEFATSAVRPGYEEKGHLFMWDGRKALENKGAFFELTYQLDMFAAPQLRKEAVAGGLLVLAIDLELDDLVNASLGSLHVNALGIHGEGPSDELMDLHVTSGNTAPQDVRVFEAWIEQPIGALRLRGGLMAADQEFVLSDQSQSLMGAPFGIPTQFGANIGGPAYPIATPGISAYLDLEEVEVRAAIYEGSLENNHGLPTQLDGYLLMGEVELYRWISFGAWHHSDKGDAIYVTADRKLDELVGVFARVGYSPDGPVTEYIDAGVRIGPGPLRKDDFMSVGMAYARTGGGDETLIEATYEAQMGWFTLQPVAQLLMRRDRDVGILATRITIVF